ncbi:MAG: universal stress protein [Saprospiraceae bacterium]
MKNILVPIDFSECASAALDVAAQWCKRFGAQLHLLHLKNKETDPELISQLIKRYPSAIFTLVERQEALWRAVANHIEAHSIYLVIMGSHGKSGKSEYFIGSNTQRVVRMVDCPVLVVKQPMEKLDFDKVLFASQFRSEDLPVFQKFKKLVEPFLPEIHLLKVHSSFFGDAPEPAKTSMEAFEKAAAPLAVHSHLVKSFSVDEGIRYLADELGVKLIGIGNHARKPLRRMLIGSVVEALVNHSDLPVLAVGLKKN